jgi:hypothetical protein
MKYEKLTVTSSGLRQLLADLAALHRPTLPAPIRVYPAAAGLLIDVEITEYEYAQLLDKDLKSRYA